MSTRAIAYLTKKKIPFETVTYTHEVKGAEFASQAIGFPLEKTVKTLVVSISAASGKNIYVLALMPGHLQLSMKKLSKILSAKKGQMADAGVAEKLTGYLTGGISPFGTTQKLAAVMDESIVSYDRIAINAGRRGMMLLMAPEDIIKAISVTVADISAEA